MSMLLAALASAALAAATEPAAVATTERAPPAAHCMDARAVGQARHLSPRLLIAQGAQGHYRIDLSETCPLASADADVAVLAPQGWVCGAENEFVRIAGRVCAIGSVTAIDAREYAQLTRESDSTNLKGGLPTMDAVEVRPDARRRFAASHEYCVDPNTVRGWNVHDNTVTVSTSGRRSGGNTTYRLELGRSCPELTLARSMKLHSGVGIGWICGNAGDAVVAQAHDEEGRFGEPMTLSTLAARAGCPVTAVYPVERLAGR